MRSFIGLGSNLGDREAYLRRALDLLRADPSIELVAVSSFRETDPVGFLDQPRFLNAAAALETELAARALLERLLAVERVLGRRRDGPRFGPRTIDLDLLLRLAERRFVLEPLHELDPGLVIPGRGPLADLLAALQ
jgi:2-amino-4-hydroxy-6-hydroxymethyldihydropteridine diphosphokinase